MSAQQKENRYKIEDHDAILEIIKEVNILSELVEKQEDHYKHELDLEVIVYGRNYEGGKVGPYAQLWVYESDAEVIRAGEWAGNSFYIFVDGRLEVLRNEGPEVDRVITECGEIFGEMAVIEGDQRSTTVVVPKDSTAKVLELQRPALRLLRKLPKFAQIFNEKYHDHSLTVTLRTVCNAGRGAFNQEMLDTLDEIARFRVYDRLHVLIREGQPITHVYFVNKGWIEVLHGIPSGLSAIEALDGQTDLQRIRFLGAGSCFGLEALACEAAEWRYTVVVQARTELLEIPIERLRAHPELHKTLKEQFSNFSEVDEDKVFETIQNEKSVAAVQKEIATGIVDGTNLLVMDMDLCIRCGNCSLACHKVHGHSRLLRRGILIERPVGLHDKSIQNVLAPSVCLHCQDPECLTGCPTGAISRLRDGEIDIDAKTCIGCGDCATQCPYNAISMIPAKSPPPLGWFSRVKDFLKLTPEKIPSAVSKDEGNLFAVKCNLCAGTRLNLPGKATKAYSCEENCPTGALVRVNPREYFSETKNLIGTIYRDQTHAIGRNIHKRDIPARLWHIFGVLTTVAITWATIWAALRYTLDQHLAGTWLTVRWVTGFVGLFGIAILMSYAARKQVYRRRAGPLRYWLLCHVYVGVVTGIVFLLHGGWHSGGLLTSMLMVSFNLTILSGLFGVATYVVAPRILTNIEGDPLLLDDLLLRRDELRRSLALIDTSDEKLKEVIKEKVPSRLLSLRYLLDQYVHPVKLTTLLAKAREEFEAEANHLKLSASSRRILINAVETTATLRRVESLIYLHQLLKLWIAPHVVSTAIMFILMIAHIIQVFYFAGR